MTDFAKFVAVVKTYSPRLQRDLGIAGFQADGVFGNLGEESCGMTELHQKHGNGLGWAQWDDRRKAFEKWCADRGVTPLDDEANYTYLVHELLTTENRALLALRGTRTRDQATAVFMTKFERPGKPALDVRMNWAKRAEAARLEAEKANVSLFSPTAPVATPLPVAAPLVVPAAPLGAPVAAVAGPAAVAEALAAPVPAAVAAPAPAVAHNPDQLLAAIEALYVKLLDFATNLAVSKGVPAPAVSVARMLINQVDVPKYAVNYLLKLAAK
jgi:hypothetical protein